MMKAFKLISGAIIVLATIGYFWQAGYFKKADLKETAEFRSAYGFTLKYPKNWLVDASQKDAPVEFIREPSGAAFVAVQVGRDDRLKNSATRNQALKEAEMAFVQDKRYKVEFFEWKLSDTKTDGDSYMAAGSYEENGAKWRFKEIAIFNHSGAVSFFRGNARAESAKIYGPILEEIIFSFKPSVAKTVTAEAARAKIELLPEVKEFQKTLIAVGKKAEIETEDGGGEWNVHVFEIVKDNAGSHTATFGWYRVDKKTGAVEKVS